MMRNKYMMGVIACMLVASCKTPDNVELKSCVRANLPQVNENVQQDHVNVGWREFFHDAELSELIDTALVHNQDLMVTCQELAIARSNVLFQKGQMLPSVTAGINIGANKVGRYTSEGAGNAGTMLTSKHEIPDVMTNFKPGIQLDWDVDIWGKLSAEKKAAIERYLATEEGQKAVRVQLIADVAENYYQLLALDNKLDLVHHYIDLQKKAVEIAQIQKEADAETQLAVEKFKAELAKAQSNEFTLRQDITERENALNLLLGQFPRKINRNKEKWQTLTLPQVAESVPTKLLLNRPDVMQAEHQLRASHWDSEAARKAFLPALNISADLGLEAFNPMYFAEFPKSLAFSVIGDMAAPIINRKAIEANYRQANAQQLEALYNYDKTLLAAYSQTCIQLSRIKNLKEYSILKEQENDALKKSIDVARELYMNNRATYLDILDSERDQQDAEMDLIDTKLSQLEAIIDMYKSLSTQK